MGSKQGRVVEDNKKIHVSHVCVFKHVNLMVVDDHPCWTLQSSNAEVQCIEALGVLLSQRCSPKSDGSKVQRLIFPMTSWPLEYEYGMRGIPQLFWAKA